MGFTETLKKLSPPPGLRMFILIIVGVVIAVSTYYLLYVRSQSGYFNDRNFRKLSLISSQIGSKLTEAGSVMEKNCERFIRPRAEDDYKFSTDPAQKKQNIAELQKVFKRLRGDSPQIIPFNIDTEQWSAKVAPNTVTLTEVRSDGDSSWLSFDYVAHGIEKGTLIRVQARTELKGLIQQLLTARVGSSPDQFQNILIAQADTSRVILQYDTAQVRLASMDKLASATTQGANINLKDIAQTSNAVDVSLAGANYRLFSHPLKLSLPTSDAPTAMWVVTGLIKADAFKSVAWSLPLPYPILIIGGFVVAMIVFSWPFLKLVLAGPKDRFKTADVYLLVFATMIVLAVGTAFALYGYVYWSVEAEMDEQVGTLANDIKTNFNAELNSALRQLDTFSKNPYLLNKLVSDEKRREEGLPVDVGGVGRDFSAAQRRSNPQKEPACRPEDRNIYFLDDTNKTKILPCVLSSCETSYPYFDTVAWIDKGGTQQAKWTIKSYTTQYVPVSDRAYFQNIQKKQFYELGGRKFWLEPIVSKTTGRNQVEISQQVRDTNWTIAFDTRLLSLMDPVLPDAFGFVVINNDGKVLFHSDEVHHLGENLLQECDDDRGLRSAVIGRTDRALDVRYAGQDHSFFVTTLDGFPEWSLVVFRNKQPLRTAFVEMLISLAALFLVHILILMGGFTIFFFIYARKGRKAWLWPEERKRDRYVQLFPAMLGLSLVSLALALLLHGQWLVWVSAALALFGSLVFFLSLRYGPWSKDRFKDRFKDLGSRLRDPRLRDRLVALVFKPETSSGSQSPSPECPPAPAPGTSSPAPTEQAGTTNAIAAIVQACDKETSSARSILKPRPSFLKRYDSIYAMNLTLLVVLIAIVPMGAFFKYEYESQITLFIKHAQFSMATAIEQRDERIRAQYSNPVALEPMSCPNQLRDPDTNILTRRLGETWDVYDQFFYGTARHKEQAPKNGKHPPATDTDLLSTFNALLPVSSQAAIERRALMANASVMGVCNWEGLTSNKLDLNLVGTGKHSWPWRRLNTTVPILGVSVLPAIMLLLLSGPLCLLIHFMIRKVFLLDIHKPSSYSLKTFLCDKIQRNSFVVVNAPFFKKSRFKADLQKFSDLVRSKWWDGKVDESKLKGDAIVFDEFEYRMDDVEINKRRLAFVEELVKKQQQLVLFSTVEPWKYNFGSGLTNGDHDRAGDWAEILISNFFTEYAEDTDLPDKSTFKQRVDEHRERLKRECQLEGRKEEEVKQLIDTVYAECALRVPLQNVGLQILKTKDFVTLTQDHLLGRICNQAWMYYMHIWDSCTQGEKQTLCHLAQDRRLSHRDPDIQALLKRELILREEGINLFNDSFGKFVLSKDQRMNVAKEEQAARDESWWQTLKVPILATMIFVAGFLFWTQQDVFTSSLAVVTGVTGLISAVFRMTSMFNSDSSKSSAKDT